MDELVTFLDLEVGTEDKKVHDIGIIKRSAVLHTGELSQVAPFLQGSRYICGHNIVNHDLKYLEKYYDFSVFLDVSPELQKSRIIKRNTPELTERFFREWIPMEQLYFDVLNVKERCNIVIPIKSSQ